MSYENTVFMREQLAYAMTRAPHFNPEEEQTPESVLAELRRRLANMQTEWRGGDELYQRMGGYIDQAEAHLNAGNALEAKRAFGEVYAIITQTPRPKKVKSA